jgi:uncharacterized protein (TIGR02265 family)
MKEGDVILTPIPQADGKVKNRPAILLCELPSYGDLLVCMVWTGEKSGRFIFKRDFLPPGYHEGVLTEVMLKVNAKEPKVHGRVIGPLDTEFDLSWS